MEDVTDVLSQAVLLEFPVLQAVLSVEVRPGDVVRAGVLAVLEVPKICMKFVSLSVLNTVLIYVECRNILYSDVHHTNLDRSIVKTELVKAVRPGGAGVGAAHHTDDEVDLHVLVLGVSDGACLYNVPVTLVGSVLTLKLVSSVNLNSMGFTVRNKVHIDIRADSLVHGTKLLGNEASTVRTQTLIVDIQVQTS